METEYQPDDECWFQSPVIKRWARFQLRLRLTLWYVGTYVIQAPQPLGNVLPRIHPPEPRDTRLDHAITPPPPPHQIQGDSS